MHACEVGWDHPPHTCTSRVGQRVDAENRLFSTPELRVCVGFKRRGV